MRPFRLTIGTQQWTVTCCRVPKTLYGDCDYEQRRIRISNRIHGCDLADTLIHELIHARWPDLSEDAVGSFAGEVVLAMRKFQLLEDSDGDQG